MTATLASLNHFANTPEQRARALKKANAVRSGRTALKRRIACGETTVAEVLANVPPEAVSWPVAHLLVAQRHWGATRARRLLARAQIGERRPVGELTERQRLMLAGMVSR